MCERRKVCGLGMRPVRAHVVHHFVMISYLVTALVCQMRGGNIRIFMTCRIHSGNFDLASKGYCPKVYVI